MRDLIDLLHSMSICVYGIYFLRAVSRRRGSGDDFRFWTDDIRECVPTGSVQHLIDAGWLKLHKLDAHTESLFLTDKGREVLQNND